MLFLPWQALTKEDLGVLESIAENLNGEIDTESLVNCCDVLCEQVVNDTPAEVLLQRPKIVSYLLHRIGWLANPTIMHNEDHGPIIEACLRSIRVISKALRERVRFYKIKEMQCPREGLQSGFLEILDLG